MGIEDFQTLLSVALSTHGQLYADLLRADIEIAKRERAGEPVPQSWRDKRRRMARKLDAERARFKRELWKARRDFWKSRNDFTYPRTEPNS